MNITDSDIQAYVDGELAPEDSARIDAAVLADVMVAARVERERRMRSMVRGAYDPVLAEPVPERLSALLAGTPEVPAGGEAHVVPLRSRRRAPGARWRIPAMALAASVAALAVSMWMRPGAPVHMQDGALLARGTLARELDAALASAPTPGVGTRVGLTFRDADGRICRSFANADIALAGLACREGGRWALRVLTRLDGPASGEFRQASSAMPDEVQAGIDARLHGDVFDAGQERAARDADWR